MQTSLNADNVVGHRDGDTARLLELVGLTPHLFDQICGHQTAPTLIYYKICAAKLSVVGA